MATDRLTLPGGLLWVGASASTPDQASSPPGGELSIPLHVPFIDHAEKAAVARVLDAGRLEGGGPWLERAEARLRERLRTTHALMTSSGTHALELALMAHGVAPGDEVIVPSFAFPSVATAVVRQGAQPVFADSRPGDPAVDAADVARRLTDRTRAVIAIHYGGFPCDLAPLRGALEGRRIALVEDAAPALDATLGGRACGTLADGGVISFHGSKNVTCGEGGVFLTDDDEIAGRALLMREMGTDRLGVRRGALPSYTWHEAGSSYLPSDVAMAILVAQLEKADEIVRVRRALLGRYLELFAPLQDRGLARLPVVPQDASPNGHLFYVICESEDARDRAAARLREESVEAGAHLVALDATPYGRRFADADAAPLPEAGRLERNLLRLPLHTRLTEAQQDHILQVVESTLSA